jgi:dienelactone hydrolase
MSRVVEHAVVVGRRKALIGVIAQPAETAGMPDRPAVIILNAGIIHRVGPSRLHVDLARTLAAIGATVLRFDLSGIGDSEPRDDGLAPLDSSLADIREAIDWLDTSRGFRRIVLIGLCSGADHAAIYGGSDSRVVGLVLLDPSIPRTKGYYWRHLGARLRQPGWLKLPLRENPIWGIIKRYFHRTAASPPAAGQAPSLDSPVVRAFLGKAYQASVDRGIEFLSVLTAGREDRHNYREQFLDAFPNVAFGTRVRLEYFAASDHTFTYEADRIRLIEVIKEWMEQTSFRGTAAPTSRAGALRSEVA